MQNLNEIIKAYPGKKVRVPDIVEVGGELLYSKKETALAMRTTVRTLTTWMKKEGCEASIYSTKSFTLFNIDEVRNWYKINKSDKTQTPPPKDTEELSKKIWYDNENVTMWNAGVAKDIETARVKRLERIKQEDEKKIRREEWLPAEWVDKTQRSFITILLQTLTNKLTSMPPRLAEKPQTQINVLLEAEFKDLTIQLKNALVRSLKNVKR